MHARGMIKVVSRDKYINRTVTMLDKKLVGEWINRKTISSSQRSQRASPLDAGESRTVYTMFSSRPSATLRSMSLPRILLLQWSDKS